MINKLKSLINSEEKKRLLSNFFSLSVLQGANYILPLITFPYLVRVLGVEKYGLLAFVNAVISYFTIFIEYGFNLTATKEISLHRDDKKKLAEIVGGVLLTKGFLFLLSAIIMVVLIEIVEDIHAYWYLYLFSFGTLLGQLLFPQWFFMGVERMYYITFLNILSKSIFTMALFIFIQNENDFYKVPIINSLGVIVAGILGLYVLKKDFDIHPVIKFGLIKQYLKNGWEVFISTFFINFYRNFYVVILGFLTTNLHVGYYSIAERVVKIIQTLQSVAGNTLFPYFSQKFNENKQKFENVTKKYIKNILALYLIITVLLFVFAKWIVLFIYGEPQADIITDIRVMSPIIFFGGLNYYFGILGLVALGYKKSFMKAVMITGVFSLILSVLMVFFWQDLGASITFVVSEILLFMLLMRELYGTARA